MKNFDLLIVYSEKYATSALSKERPAFPFSHASKRTNYNNAYAYFLQMCQEENISAAFTTTKDMALNGSFKSYWIYEENKWTNIQEACRSNFIFDKFLPIDEKMRKKRKTLFSSPSITAFNNTDTFRLFFDKQKTYNHLSEFTIPTVSVKNFDTNNIEASYQKLKDIINMHPYSEDFSNEIVVKDKFGAGGDNIFKVGENNVVSKISEILSENKKNSFVIQPFTKFGKGYGKGTFKGFVDIRIIFLDGNIIQSYIRKPSEGDFRCNEHQGGKLEYVSFNKLPKKVTTTSLKISKLLNKEALLYALDFIISDSGNVYLMEGNSQPGIDWNLSLKKNERNAKKLIQEIVKTIKCRIPTQKTEHTPSVFPVHTSGLTRLAI